MTETPANPQDQSSAWVAPRPRAFSAATSFRARADRCPQCRTSFSIAVRKASREIIGPWYYLDPRNPSGRGVTLETLLKMIEKGRLRPDSIVRGPTTHQDWMYAAETPRLAKYFGMCPHCFGEVKPEETFCTHCQLNMNTRPADPRPGIPPYLVKPPVHRAAYETEMQLVGAEAAAPSDSLGDEALVAPVAAVAPLPPPEAPPAPPPPAPAEEPALAAVEPAPAPAPTSSVPAELTAALSEKRAGAATAPRRKKSMVWGTLLVTAIILGVLGLVAYVFTHGGGSGPDGGSSGGTPGGHTQTSDEAWVGHQMAQADQAERSSNYPKAIEILRSIVDKTQNPVTRQTMESRIHAIQDKIKQVEDEKQAALTKLAARLKQAQSLADRQDFENALLALNNIGEDDRKALAAQGISVAKMEAEFHARQDKWNAEQQRLKQQEEALDAQLETARAAEKEGKLKEAIAQYKRLAADFPAAMVLKRVDVQAKVTDLETKLASAATTTEPTKEPAAKPKATTAAEIAKEVAEIVDQADALGKQEKFEQARLKLEEIVRNYEEKYWPEKLKDRIKQLKDREEALKFFGIGGNKK